MSLEKAIQENTAAMLKLAESNIILADSFTGETTKPKVEEKTTKPEVKKDKKPSTKKEKPEPQVEDEPKAPAEEAGETKSEVTGDDLRKVAGKLVEDGKKADFQAVLKQFGAKNITLFEKEEGADLAGMLAALEEVAGCKLAEIAD